MKTLHSSSGIVALGVIILLCVSTSFSRQDFFSHHPWPSVTKSTGPEKAASDRQLYTIGTHLDTAAFTLYPADLIGVLVGNARWIDYDNDADLDIFVSGTDGSAAKSIMYRNDAGAFSEVDVGIPPIITERGVSWGDFDNDGDFDLAITGTLDTAGDHPVSKIFRNDGGSFTDINAGLQDILGGVATWIDYNMDGRLDLLIAGSPDHGSTFVTRLYRNEDSVFVDTGIFFPGVWGASVDWGDYDNDGDPDLLLTGYGTWGMTSALYRNDGETFAHIALPFEPVVFSAVSWGDFDGDGRLDFVVSGNPPGWTGLNTFTALYHSNADGTFTLVPTDLPQLNGCGAAWGDYDNDGDLDLAIDGWHDDSTNLTRIYRNDGGGVFTDIHAGLPGTWWGSVAWGDVDNDGRLDLLISGGTGPQPFAAFYYGYVPWNPFYPVTQIYHNEGAPVNAPPTAPTSVAVTAGEGGLVFSWSTSNDDRTPSSMLTYNLRVGTSPGAADIVSPASNLATGYRRVPEPGNNGHKISRSLALPMGDYYWSIQAVDNGYLASSFTTEARTARPREALWSLVSVPLECTDWHASVIYPTAQSGAYAYSPSGYTNSDELSNGTGYWMKFAIAEDPAHPPFSLGPAITTVDIPVTEGWNLVGSIGAPVVAANVTSDPPSMATSQFFGYHDSYVVADVITPGEGYWIKASVSGTLTLSSTGGEAGPAAGTIRMSLTGESPPPPPGDDPVVEVSPEALPSEFSLTQNYPNPFNPRTLVEYALPSDEYVVLTVFNTLGQVVATPVSGYRQAGTHTAEIDAHGLPSGVYFYRLVAGTFSQVRKMALMR
jgi:hypothetical protein